MKVRKIIGIVLAIVFLSGIGVLAVNAQLDDVKIELQNGYELTTLTSKKKVSEILEENNIILEEDEKVIPGLEEEITPGATIKITHKSAQEVQIAKISEEGVETSIDELLENYAPITEKIVIEEEPIPFETITKNTTNETEETTSKVLQEGRDGVKETTYKVKYQKEQEIEKTVLSEKVIKEPINKIVQVNKKAKTPTVTSRGSSATRTGKGGWTYSAEDIDLLCAITAQEASSSYTASLAVITCACNRAESSKWASRGRDPLSQYKAKGQFCYTLDSKWKRKLNGNYPSFVKQAVTDALNGKRNHNYLSFRSAGTVSFGENIGGNVYFNPM